MICTSRTTSSTSSACRSLRLLMVLTATCSPVVLGVFWVWVLGGGGGAGFFVSVGRRVGAEGTGLVAQQAQSKKLTGLLVRGQARGAKLPLPEDLADVVDVAHVGRGLAEHARGDAGHRAASAAGARPVRRGRGAARVGGGGVDRLCVVVFCWVSVRGGCEATCQRLGVKRGGPQEDARHGRWGRPIASQSPPTAETLLFGVRAQCEGAVDEDESSGAVGGRPPDSTYSVLGAAEARAHGSLSRVRGRARVVCLFFLFGSLLYA